MNLKKIRTTLFLVFSAIISICSSQTRTVGLMYNDSANAFNGYTLFAPKQDTMTYLINNDGRLINEWKASHYAPGQSVYLLENGNLLRTCELLQQPLSTGGGEGGRLEEYTWNDSLIWSMNYSSTSYMQHHDAKYLPNGDIIMLVVEKKTVAEVLNAGFDTSNMQEPDFKNQKELLPDAVVEIKPTPPVGGIVVWEWHVWDHLIQSNSSADSNFGVPSAHPELINVAGDGRKIPVFWNHMNSIDYDSALDQIALSVRGNSEVWIIDHSTTTAEAKGHTGGVHGRGGDLLYRWGDPHNYGAGTPSNQMFFEQHDAEWIKPGCPGAGDIMCFNNGVSRNYSSVDEITTPVDGSGNYALTTGSAYGPTSLTWTYVATPPSSMYADDICGAQRLPNGNTLINYGTKGKFLEVTSSGTLVWEYINPTDATGPVMQGDTAPNDPTHADEKMNSTFRVYRYPTTYSAFTGKILTPGNYIEFYPSSVNEVNQVPPIQCYPNPFTNKISLFNISGTEKNYELLNVMGQIIWHGKQIGKQDFSGLASGVYFLKINKDNSTQTIKLIKQ